MTTRAGSPARGSAVKPRPSTTERSHGAGSEGGTSSTANWIRSTVGQRLARSWAEFTTSSSKCSARVVVYRRPVTSRAADEEELADLVRRVVVEQVALMLGRRPEEIDPDIL